jgi:hypothetical protein
LSDGVSATHASLISLRFSGSLTKPAKRTRSAMPSSAA